MQKRIWDEIKQTYYQENFKNDNERIAAWYLRNVYRRDRIKIKYDLAGVRVKPRDLRANDPRVLNLKMLFEKKYPQGYFIAKRAEVPPADKDKTYILDLLEFGKYLISWHSQRPGLVNSETKIFGTLFEQLFEREYDPENIQALNFLMQEIMSRWTPDNPFGLNGSLLTMKTRAPYQVLCAISQLYAIASNQMDRVPYPKSVYKRASDNKIVEQIVKMASSCVNVAFETAANEPQPKGKTFNPQKWITAEKASSGIKTAVGTELVMLPEFSGGMDLKKMLVLPAEDFEHRWRARTKTTENSRSASADSGKPMDSNPRK